MRLVPTLLLALSLGAALAVSGCGEITVSCSSNADCADEFTCTDNICQNGECVVAVTAGRCFIDNACYLEGDKRPNDSCQECAPSSSGAVWTPITPCAGGDIVDDTTPDATPDVTVDATPDGPQPDITPDTPQPDATPDVPVTDVPVTDVPVTDVQPDATPDVPLTCIDNDGDGFGDNCAAGNDCDDTNSAINPDAVDIPDDGVDQDCVDGDLSAYTGPGVYVTVDNCDDTGAGDIFSPFCTLAAALAAVPDGGNIFMGEGQFSGSALLKSVNVYGGYGPGWDRQLVPWSQTFISFIGSEPAITVPGPVTAIIDGVTLLGYEGADTGTTVAFDVSGTASLTNFAVFAGDSAGTLVGVQVNPGATLTARKGTVDGGKANISDAVVNAGTLTMDRVRVAVGASNSQSTGIRVTGGVAVVTNTLVEEGRSINAGGTVLAAAVVGGEADLFHCTLSGGIALNAASALQVTDGTVKVVNTALIGGLTLTGDSAALRIQGTPSVILAGSRLFAGTAPIVLTPDTPVVDATELAACSWTGCTAADANTVGNTRRVQVRYFRENLVPNSPAIDAGVDPAAYGHVVAHDYHGEPRPNGAAPDVGADEAHHTFVASDSANCSDAGPGTKDTPKCNLSEAVGFLAQGNVRTIFATSGSDFSGEVNINAGRVGIFGGFSDTWAPSSGKNTELGGPTAFNLSIAFAEVGVSRFTIQNANGSDFGDGHAIGMTGGLLSVTQSSLSGGFSYQTSGLKVSGGGFAYVTRSELRGGPSVDEFARNGLYLDDGEVEVHNSLVTAGSVPTFSGASAIRASSGSLRIFHSTIVGLDDPDANTANAINLFGPVQAEFYNLIVLTYPSASIPGENPTRAGIYAGDESDVVIEGLVIDGPCPVLANPPSCITTTAEVEGCAWSQCSFANQVIMVDPQVNAGTNWRLPDASVAIEYGKFPGDYTRSNAIFEDIDGEFRPQNQDFDCGWDEWYPPSR